MKTPKLSSAPLLYGALLVAFHLAARFLPAPKPAMEGLPPPPVSRSPELQLRRNAAGAPLAGVDGEVLRRSLQRVPAVIWLRRVGNSLRLALGQVPEWYFRGGAVGQPETLFLASELPLAEGMTPAQRETVRRAAGTIADLHRRLSSEGWTVLLAPAPSKLNLYRERVAWPLDQRDPFTRRPLDQDRSDEVSDALFRELRAAGVPAVDLRAEARQAIARGVVINPDGESHWSAAGLGLVAREITAALGGLGLETTDDPPSARPVPYRLSADMAERSESLDGFPPWLARLRWFDETVTRGAKPPGARTALVAVSGTSYTGQYSWLGDAGLAAELDRRLPNALVRSFAEAGRGSLQTARSFLAQRETLLRETDPAVAAPGKRYWVWEFPMRDIAGFNDPITWVPLREAAGVAPLVRFGEGFHQEEESGARFRWVRRHAEVRVTVPAAGTYRAKLRCVTPFSPREGSVGVFVGNRFAGAAAARGTDFKRPAESEIEMDLPAGESVLRLEYNRDEVTFGPNDPRPVAFGLVLPLDLTPAG